MPPRCTILKLIVVIGVLAMIVSYNATVIVNWISYAKTPLDKTIEAIEKQKRIWIPVKNASQINEQDRNTELSLQPTRFNN